MYELKDFYTIIDLLASEYGWDINQIYSLDIFDILQLVKAIKERKKQDLKLFGLAVGLAFAGKLDKLDDVFSEQSTSEEETIGQLQDLFMKCGGDVKKFNEMLKKGEIKI